LLIEPQPFLQLSFIKAIRWWLWVWLELRQHRTIRGANVEKKGM